jgi:hypothetical protein
MSDKKLIDLPAQEYRAERDGEKQPFWGPDALQWLFWAIGAVIVALAVRYFR